MKKHAPVRFRESQQGLVLEIVLVVLIALFLTSISLFRSVDTSSTVSGNISFKSDATHRAQLAFDQVLAWVSAPGNFGQYIDDGADLPGANYSARMLQTDAQGIPLILKDTTVFDAAYTYNPPATALMEADEMTVRYLIERMCTDYINAQQKAEYCTYAYKGIPDDNSRPLIKEPDRPALRVTIRVDGPRNTVSYVQATVRP